MEENKNENQITSNGTNNSIQNEVIPNQVPQNNNGKKSKGLIIVLIIIGILLLCGGAYFGIKYMNKENNPNGGINSTNEDLSSKQHDNDRNDNRKGIYDIVTDMNTTKAYVGSQFLIDTSSGEEEIYYYDSRIELLLYDNNKYWLTDSNEVTTQAYEGNYSIDGDILTLNPKVWHHSRGCDYNVENDEEYVKKYILLNGRIINIDSKEELYLTHEENLSRILESINMDFGYC